MVRALGKLSIHDKLPLSYIDRFASSAQSNRNNGFIVFPRLFRQMKSQERLHQTRRGIRVKKEPSLSLRGDVEVSLPRNAV